MPKPPKKPAPPTRITVAAMNKAAQAASDDPAAATMMELRKTIPVASAALRAADPASLTSRSKSSSQVLLIGEIMTPPLAAYNAGRASVQPAMKTMTMTKVTKCFCSMPADESALVQPAAT